MREAIIHFLKYGIVLGSTAVLASSCVSTPRVPFHAFDHPNHMYLTYTEKTPVKPGLPAHQTNGVNVAGWEDVITAVPDILEAYKEIEIHTRIVSIEFFIADTNSLSNEAVDNVLKTFKEVTNR
jgi:hypothetical protein